MYTFNHSKTRPATTKLLDMADEGMISWEAIAQAALGWMSEDDVADMARVNDFFEAEEEEEGDGQPDEAQEWHDFDPEC